MKDRPVLVAIVLLLLVLGVFATPAISAPIQEIGCKNKNYFAKDSVNEPGVERGHFKYDDDETVLDYDLKILKDETFLDGLIHIRAQNNPPVLSLDYTQGWSTLTEDDLLPPYEGLTFHYLRLLMDYNMTYLNLTVETETGTKEVLAPIFNNGVCILSDSLIMGIVFYDDDGDGIFDAGEYGIEGIEVSVANGETDTTSTDGSGMFVFSVYPGSYNVIVDPDGYNNTTPTEVSVDVPIGSGAFVLFGLNGTPPTPQPAIDIEKYTNGFDADTLPGPSIPVGNAVEWEYIVTNIGNVDLTEINITDDQLEDICTISSLQTGESDSCKAYGTAVAGLYANVGNVTAKYDEMVVSDEDPSHYTGTSEEAAIDIEKSTNGFDADGPTGPEITVGNPITWTYYVSNIGDKLLQDVTITDDDPAVNANITCPDIANGEITLKKGENITCTATGVATLGQYENNATAFGKHGSEVVNDSDLSHYLGVEGAFYSDLAITKSTIKDTYYLDEIVTWTVTVTNFGSDDADDVIVVEDISGLEGVNFINNSTRQGIFDGTIWNVGSLMTSESATLTINTTFASTGLKTNNVSVSSSNCDPVPGNNTYSASVTIEKSPPGQQADLSINKTHLPGTYYPGDTVTWTVTVTNNGPQKANATATDVLDLTGSITDSSASQGSFNSGTGIWQIGELKNKDSATLTLNTTFSTSGWKENTVSVSSEWTDPNPADNSASDSVYIMPLIQTASIDIEKYVLVNRSGEWSSYDGEDPEEIPALLKDEAFRWEIWVENNGTVPLELTWTDSYNGTPLDLNATCENLPTSLTPGANYSCLIDDVAKADDPADDLPFNKTLFVNQVRVEGKYDGLNATDEDYAAYVGVESLYGVMKFIIIPLDPVGVDIYDANEPSGPDIKVGDGFSWGFLAWNMQGEAATLTWQDDYNGTQLDTTGFPTSVAAFNSTGTHVTDTAVPGLFYNNVTVSFNYTSLDDVISSDIAYYTGYYPAPYATVKGFVFNDTDADGAWNKSYEPGLAGANVTIANTTWSASATTGPDGNFTLHVPATGDYVITETNPAGYVSTNAIPGDGATKWDNDNMNISIAAFTMYKDHLFGDVLEESVAVLAGRVFDDENENGTWDAGETGLPGVNVTMEIQDNPMPITVKTNATGEYQFAVLPGTNVRISSEGPGGDYYPTTLEALSLTPPSATLYPGNNFGYSDDEDVAVIFGIVFNDTDSNGEQDLGESGLPGANVTFDGTTSVITSCNNLTCGTFTFVTDKIKVHAVHEENPSGFRSTTPDDVNVPVDNLGESYSISFGDTNRTDTASIYGVVFDDCNGNGKQDPDEPGIEGVKINLTDASGMEILNTSTKTYGQYTFGILNSGVYNVLEQDPAKEGYRSTTPDRVPVEVALGKSYVVDFGDTNCTGFSTIMGTVFDDVNRDGVFNWSELGIRDVKVELSNGNSTLTGDHGTYTLKVNTSGWINVTETDPPGYDSTTDNEVPVNVTLDLTYTVDFGDAKKSFATITACKKDNYGNNLSDWQMNLLREEDGAYWKQNTSEDGCTVFSEVEIGAIYKLFESQKEGWRAIEPADGTVEPIHHAHYEVNVTEPGDYRYTFVNEEFPESNVYVYACKNDTSGTPLIGWAMILTADGGGAGPGPEYYQSGMTDDTGCTVFTLNYTDTVITALLEEVRKPGWVNVTDLEYGFTISEPGTYPHTFVNRREGEEMSTIKAVAYRDNNRNGVQDLPSETGLAGVTFTLRLDDDQIGQKTTDSSGTVSFTNLEADTYRLSAAPPSSRWYLTSGSSARDVTVAEDETVEETFGYRYRGRPGPGPGPEPEPPEVEAEPECDFYENGTLTINEEGLNLETIVICALDGIGKLIVYDGVTALNPLGEPLEWATIVVIPGAPDAGERYTFMGTAYNCSPNGATFDSPITLLMEFGEYQWAELSGKNLVIMRWDAGTGEWEKLPTTINENEWTVFADVTELGIFALFVEGPPVVEVQPEIPVTIIVFQYYWWILAVIIFGTVGFITLMAHRENEKAL